MAEASELAPARRLRYRVDAGILRSLAGAVHLFSIDQASAIGAWVGRNVVAPLSRKNRSTIETLRTAFPQLDERGVEAVLTDSYENVGRVFAELALLERFVGPDAKRRFTFQGLEHLRAAQASGKGMIVASGHFANWEMTCCALHHLGVPFSAVARPSSNPWVSDWIANKRRVTGMRDSFPRGTEGTRKLFSALRSGEAVIMLVDQQLPKGIPAPLFGRNVMTTHAPATLAQKLDIAVLPMGVRRTKGSNFAVAFHPPLRFPRTGNDARDVLAMTAELNRFVEGEVRATPAHWLWTHRRFKPVAALSPRASRVLGRAGTGP